MGVGFWILGAGLMGATAALLYEQTKQYDLAFADYDTLISLRPDVTYYREREAALLHKMARETEPIILKPGSPIAQPTARPEVESKPAATIASPEEAPRSAVRPKVAGQGDCRRFDPIANLTISVACPE